MAASSHSPGRFRRTVSADNIGASPQFDPEDMFIPDNSVWQNNNEVYFYSEVSTKSCMDLIKGVRAAEKFAMKHAIDLGMKPGDIGITVRVNSPGGSVHDGFAAMDAIMACSVPVTTVVEGLAASAATFISVAGSRRLMTPNSFMLIHQLSSGVWGKMDDMEDEMVNLAAVMRKIMSVYTDRTGLKKKDLKDLLKKDMLWDAETCLAVGLVHSVA